MAHRFSTRLLSALAVAMVLVPGTALATNWGVSAVAGSDANDGITAPFRTITKALSVASDGDFIRVDPGNYTTAIGEVFPLQMKSGVKLLSNWGAEMTVIDAGSASPRQRVFDFNGTSSTTLLLGFTIKGGKTTPAAESESGGGIRFRNGDLATVTRNIIEVNQVEGMTGGLGGAGTTVCGGGVLIHLSSTQFLTNVVRNNSARGGFGGSGLSGPVGPVPGGAGGDARGGGICVVGGSAKVWENTIVGNAAQAGSGGSGSVPGAGGASTGGGMWGNSGTPQWNIFAYNEVVLPLNGLGTVSSGGLYMSTGTAERNLYYANSPNDGTLGSNAVVGQDPLFVSLPGDLDLERGSPAGSRIPLPGGGRDFDGAPRPPLAAIGAFEPPFAPEDLDGDDRNDLLWRQPSSGANVYWRMDGTTRLGYGSLLAVPGTAWSMVGSGDFNGDGRLDILWRNTSTGENVVWLMNGTVRTSYVTIIGVPAGWDVGAVDDFDRDGDADIVWRNGSTGQNVLWTMNGTDRLSYTTLIAVPGAEWKLGGSGDFNYDGRPDLIWRNYTTGQNVAWFMNNAVRTEFATLLSIPDPAWRLMAVADYNDDFMADIVWRNVSTGQNVIWFMNGIARTSYASLLPVSDLSWEIQAPR